MSLQDCDPDARAAGLRAVYEQAGLSMDNQAPEPIAEYEIIEKDAIAVLLLWKCTNLETLRLSVSFWAHWHVEQYLTLANYGRLPGLANVKRVEFATPGSQADDSREFDIFYFPSAMQLIHRLPQLETVLLETVREGQTVFDNRFVPRWGNIKRLELSYVDMSYNTFAMLMSIPKELEALKLWMGGMITVEGSPDWYARYAWRLLLPHKDTLTSLDIDTDTLINGGRRIFDYDSEDDEEESEDEEFIRPAFQEFKEADEAIGNNYSHQDIEPTNEDGEFVIYGSFADFKTLKHLRIGVKSLLGPPAPRNSIDEPIRLLDLGVRLVDLLPSSLESFALYGYDRGFCKDVDEQVDELMEVKSDRFPSFVTIEGVHNTIDSIYTLYGFRPQDGKHWDRGEQDWGWK